MKKIDKMLRNARKRFEALLGEGCCNQLYAARGCGGVFVLHPAAELCVELGLEPRIRGTSDQILSIIKMALISRPREDVGIIGQLEPVPA